MLFISCQHETKWTSFSIYNCHIKLQSIALDAGNWETQISSNTQRHIFWYKIGIMLAKRFGAKQSTITLR